MDDEKERECKIILEKKNYYDILGVEKTADDNQIKKAYRKLAIKFHPDKNKAKSAEEAFKKVNQAFCVLSDKNKRKNYDIFGTEEGPGISTMSEDFNPFDIFEQFFQDFGGMGGFHRGNSGRTTFSFNNGTGTFTVFSSGFGNNPFFSGNDEDEENDDNFINPFEEIFFGGSRTRQRNNRNNNRNSNSNSNRKDNNRNRRGNRTNREEMRRHLENNINNASLVLQFFPLIFFLFIFIIIPWIFRIIFTWNIFQILTKMIFLFSDKSLIYIYT